MVLTILNLPNTEINVKFFSKIIFFKLKKKNANLPQHEAVHKQCNNLRVKGYKKEKGLYVGNFLSSSLLLLITALGIMYFGKRSCNTSNIVTNLICLKMQVKTRTIIQE